jgi:hypothetical protein
VAAAAFVHQIFYDEVSRTGLGPGFIPLDNTANERPDWYELWPIRKFLHGTTLQPDAWYGFLSPRFSSKTGLTAQHVSAFLDALPDKTEVLLLSHSWDQIAYYQNVFEQGEAFHPGLVASTQAFLDASGIVFDAATSVSHSLSGVFSNYVIAKPRFWWRWRALADQLFDYAEHGTEPSAIELRNTRTLYGEVAAVARLAVFLQERLATLALMRETFDVVSFFPSDRGAIFTQLFGTAPETRGLLRECDLLKQRYTATGDVKYLAQYRARRAMIAYTPPPITSAKWKM